jgi:ornithine decarboxylase
MTDTTAVVPARATVSRRGLTGRQHEFLADSGGLTTPFLVLDLDIVAACYRELCATLPEATVYYAVKANPAPEVLAVLRDLGCSFDVASPGEIERCLALGVDASRLSYGNTIKKQVDIDAAHRAGLRQFTVDSAPELDKVLRGAPGATVFIRLATGGEGADWPLSRKFGCTAGEAATLAARAVASGLDVGFSFHVGSQQRHPDAWGAPLAAVAALLDRLVTLGARPAGVNIGGGLPSDHVPPTPAIAEYGATIRALVHRHLGRHLPMPLLVEPGRYLVGDAGLIETEVVLISERDVDPGRRWVYLDVGLFNGLTETRGEAIRYRIRCPDEGGPRSAAVLAGPSCDSADILYERRTYDLPTALRIGDRVQILSTGAYTSSYSSVWFNGFEPLPTYMLPASDGGPR